jgi:hypothetical protein
MSLSLNAFLTESSVVCVLFKLKSFSNHEKSSARNRHMGERCFNIKISMIKLKEWLKWQSACLPGMMPWVQTPVQRKKFFFYDPTTYRSLIVKTRELMSGFRFSMMERNGSHTQIQNTEPCIFHDSTKPLVIWRNKIVLQQIDVFLHLEEKKTKQN